MNNITLLKALSNIDEQYLIDYEKVQEKRNRVYDDKPRERVISMKILSPILAVAVIAGIVFMAKPKTETPIVSDYKNTYTMESEEKVNLNINKIDNVMMADMDADVKILNGVMIPYFEYMTRLSIPDDFDNKEDYKAIWVKSNRDVNEYDILNNYEFTYRNTTNSRRIIIAFSEEHKPLRDYYIKGGEKTTTIGNTELIISQYKDMFLTTFTHNGVNYDIETRDITEDELLELLKSIILKPANYGENVEDMDIGIKESEQINTVKDFPDYYGGVYVQNGKNVILLVEDTPANRTEICELLGITESLTTFRTAKYSHNYLTILQDKISEAMQNKEFKSVIGSGLMDAQNHILVTMTKDDKSDTKKLEKLDTKGGAIAIEVRAETFSIEDLKVKE